MLGERDKVMGKQPNSIMLDELLQTYFLETKSPQVDLLEKWVNKHPQFEKELRDFTVAWSMIEFFCEGESLEHMSDRNILDNETRIAEFLKEAKKILPTRSADKMPISSLIVEAKQNDITIEDLAKRIDLSVPIVAKLDSRLIEYVSIPLEVLEGLAEAILREIILIARYLNQPPKLSQIASYKSHRKPSIPKKENFFDVIRHDDELSNRQRVRWLTLEDSE
jgi:transcriptional regulator with XRE-family HTH domain